MRCTSRSLEHAMWKRLSKYALKQRVVHSSTPKCKHGNGVMTVIAQVLRSESNTLQRRVPCFFMNKYERASLLLMTTFWDIELPTQRNSLPELFNRIFMLLKFCQEHTHALARLYIFVGSQDMALPCANPPLYEWATLSGSVDRYRATQGQTCVHIYSIGGNLHDSSQLEYSF